MRASDLGNMGTQSISRAVSILRHVATHNRSGIRLLDLARETGFKRPTVHRMLKLLSAEMMVRQDKTNRRYFLGSVVYELGLAAAVNFNLRELCQGAVFRLAEKTCDTLFLTQRSHLDGVCIERREGSFPIKTFVLDVGVRRPLGIGAGSLAILGAMPDQEIKYILAANAQRLKRLGRISPGLGSVSSEQIQLLLTRARKRGYVLRETSVAPGVRTIGMPICNAIGEPIAAISISAIASRMSEARLAIIAQMMRAEIKDLERTLQHGQYMLHN